jgi:CDGSH-type Zn-finger protein
MVPLLTTALIQYWWDRVISVPFGEEASTEHSTLCRCGASKNKPFCDGSHWEVGFRISLIAHARDALAIVPG